MIAGQIFLRARMIPLYTGVDEDKDQTEIRVDLAFQKVTLRRKSSEVIIAMIQQDPSQVDAETSIGRLICGEMRNGGFEVLWDSRLFNAYGDGMRFEDVNADGWQEIVIESEIGGHVRYPVLTIFDKDGREITRQKYCDIPMRPFAEDAGVCPIQGVDIRFGRPSKGPEEIIVKDWPGGGEGPTIFRLQNGMYDPELPKRVPRPAKKKPAKSADRPGK